MPTGAELEQLLERERVAALATFAGEVAHAVATPVAYFRALFTDGATSTLSPEDMDAGREEIAKLELLLAGLRGLAHVGGAAPESSPPFRLRAVAQLACDAVRRALPASCVSLALDETLEVAGDAQRMALILASLLRALPHAASSVALASRIEGEHVQLQLELSPSTASWPALDATLDARSLALLCAANLARLARWPLEFTSRTISLRAPLSSAASKGALTSCEF